METKMSNKYYNFKQGVKSKPQLLTLEQIEKLKIEKDQDAYVSIYSYSDKHKELVDKTGSVKGIKDVVTSTLVWDFDCKNDLEKARQDVLTLASRLVDTYNIDPDNISCYFTGSKGFHVVLALTKKLTVDEFKVAVNTIGGDLETFDLQIFDHARVLRLEHTKNLATGLYKIPLHIAEVDEMNVDQIKELAKTSRQDYVGNVLSVSMPDSLFKVKEKKKDVVTMTPDFNLRSIPKGWKPYKWALAEGHFTSGERHSALMVVAATCRGLGYDKTTTYHICKSAIEKQALRNGEDKFDKEELYKNIIEDSVFSDTWNGGQYSPATNPWLKKYCEKMGFDSTDKDDYKVIQLRDIQGGFVHFVDHIEENTILTGIPELDEKVPLTVGMNLGLLAPPSVGKTALALKILKNTSDAGVISVLASLDMHRNRIYEKILYAECGLSRKELYQRIKDRKADDIFKKVEEKYKNVYFYDRSSPTVSDIRAYMTQVEEQTGKKVKLVVIDYFERINADKSDETAASKEVAGKLQDLLNDTNICLITLVQPNKFSISGGPDTPITSYGAIKGSSFLSQSFRAIIALTRPFFNPEYAEHDRFMQMSILKNDLGEIGQMNFGWNGKLGDIWGLTEEGEEELARLLKMKEDKKNKKADDEGSGGWN